MCNHPKFHHIIFRAGEDLTPRIQCGICAKDITNELKTDNNIKYEKDWEEYVYESGIRQFLGGNEYE